MGYEKQEWVDNTTVIDAEKMNHIEEGISTASATIEKYFSGGDSDVPGEETLSPGHMVLVSGYTGVNEASDAHMYITVTRGRTIKIENAYVTYNRSIVAYLADRSFVKVLATATGPTPYSMTCKVDNFDMISVTSKAGEAIKVSYVDGMNVNDNFMQAILAHMRTANTFAGLATCPVCSIIDDDTTTSAFAETFASLMEQNGITGTYACITSRFEADTALKATLLKMEQRGIRWCCTVTSSWMPTTPQLP